MLRKILMTTVAASAMVGSAYAADLPRREPPPAYVPPVPIFTWTGFYIGANVGGAFRANNRGPLEDAVFFGGAAPVGALIVANNNNNSGRFLIGGQAGYNWQINNFVLGIEGDGDVALGRTETFPASSMLAPIRVSSRLCGAGEVSPLTASSSTAQAVSPSATAETSATRSSAPPLVGWTSSRPTIPATRLSATL